METYYDILQVKRDATSEQIKRSFLSLVSRYHPDIYRGDPEFAQKLTASLTEAYTTLKNDDLRHAYDEKVFGKKRIFKNDIYTRRSTSVEKPIEASSQSEVKTILRNTKMKKSKRLKKNFFKTKLFYFLLIFFSIEVVILLFLVRE